MTSSQLPVPAPPREPWTRDQKINAGMLALTAVSAIGLGAVQSGVLGAAMWLVDASALLVPFVVLGGGLVLCRWVIEGWRREDRQKEVGICERHAALTAREKTLNKCVESGKNGG